uniref:Secreted protein n=1 Tax=Parascaris equorum TaxID=6256 RepID=A0A914RXK1_PAREQ
MKHNVEVVAVICHMLRVIGLTVIVGLNMEENTFLLLVSRFPALFLPVGVQRLVSTCVVFAFHLSLFVDWLLADVPVPVALPPFTIEITKGNERLCFHLDLVESGDEEGQSVAANRRRHQLAGEQSQLGRE